MKADFSVGNTRFTVESSMLGKEEVLVGGRVVSRKRSFGRKSTHEFEFDGKDYKLEINAGSFPPQVNMRLLENGKPVHEQLYSTSGKPIEESKRQIPTFGWLFFAACVAIPVLSLGGAVPGAIGLGGGMGCLALSRDSSRSGKLRIALCALVAVLSWVAFLAFALLVVGLKPG